MSNPYANEGTNHTVDSAAQPMSVPSSFSDVPSGAWYEEAVAWTAESSIMSGYTDGRFGADDPVTREQMAAIFWRYAGSTVWRLPCQHRYALSSGGGSRLYCYC